MRLALSRVALLAAALCVVASIPLAGAASAATAFNFSTDAPDARMAMATRPESAGNLQTEAADDFLLSKSTSITNATFTGLIPTDADPSSIRQVVVEIYRVFPKDSQNPPSGHVPTRDNSPSDVAFASRESGGASPTLTYAATTLNPQFTAANKVDTGINPKPNQRTGGEGPVTGQEVRFDVTFSTAFDLAADQYFFVPQVELSTGHFFWLSAPKPIVAPGTPFNPDLQAWIRNSNLEPDWLRVGTDIVGGTTPPTFNAAFSLHGSSK